MPRELSARPTPLLLRLLDEGAVSALTDAQLVERFAAGRDPEAFAALVARHGPLVMGACRGVLDAADAEDAFQATFLVLLKRIGTFPVGPSLGGWLYRVARRVARQDRLSQARRRRREASRPGPEAGSGADAERSELLAVIRQEVGRLPERYRAAIVLCDLEGLTREQAAAVLGCPAGTVGGRLARARRKLRDGLARRGVDPATAFPTPFAPALAVARRAAFEAASSLAAGARPTPAVAALAARAVAPWAALKSAAALTVAAFLAGGLLAAAAPSEPPPRKSLRQAPATAPPPEPEPAPDPDAPANAGRFAGRVVDREGRPIAGARIYVAPRGEGTPRDLGPARALSRPDGRFAFEAADMTFESLDGLPARREGLMAAGADGYAPDWARTWGEGASSFRSHWDPIKGADLTLRLVRDVPIRGRIVDPEGRPVAGARVRLETLTIPDRNDLDGYLVQVRTILGGACNGRPISPPEVLPGVPSQVATDAEGRFRMTGLGADRVAYLRVSASGFADCYLTVVTRETADVPTTERDMQGRPAHTTHGASFTASLDRDRSVAVSGLVIAGDTREPLAGVRVGRGDGSPRPEDVVTGPDGRFTMRGILPEELEPVGPLPADPMAAAAARQPLRLAAAPGPGRPYLPASTVVDRRDGVVIECLRGVPYRLKVVDEAGAPVEATVDSYAVSPNPYLASLPPGVVAVGQRPVGRALRTDPGVYEGVLAPGPAAVLVQTPSVRGLRPPFVDPKAFFAPGKADWTEQEARTSYGDGEYLILGPNWHRQEDYAAIALADPPVGSGPLELSATVVRDRPRTVTLLDPDGRPLVGVVPDGLTLHPGDQEPRLRAATAAISKLDPGRGRRITFVHEGRKLAGDLVARGDDDAPYTVTLQPWASVTGRIVDARGSAGVPEKTFLDMGTRRRLAAGDDPGVGVLPVIQADGDGRFRFERLVPGRRYGAEVFQKGSLVGTAFEDLVLRPGEARDLGDVRTAGP
ncbi:sigma-70 family RNA polymerase sigma factor [Paludisphaera mucosa]|uniref:Sigma-70 family RNA polymerase sigma factor n=1 Tax=Paludisphaera mucosa TaxID=3030827 RepID=A0ABT6FJB4_9BACT|nr:sigma-70 family RNA polymerase sigma factor [Paludisphaera mucosa]MDG3007680.1 sigma-70 family RNA polymerase sigma factor [Paludisphaera mucosa]